MKKTRRGLINAKNYVKLGCWYIAIYIEFSSCFYLLILHTVLPDSNCNMANEIM